MLNRLAMRSLLAKVPRVYRFSSEVEPAKKQAKVEK